MEQFSDDELDHAAEEDSDKEDQDLDKMFGAWLGELDKLTQSLDDGKSDRPHRAPLRQETNMANFSYRFSIYNINEALNQGDNVDLDSLMADLCSIEQELSTIGKPGSASGRLGVPGDAKVRQKPPAGRSGGAKVGGTHTRPPLGSNFSLDDITAQLERASLSMDPAGHAPSPAPFASSSSSYSSREARAIVQSARPSINSASASSMESLDVDLEGYQLSQPKLIPIQREGQTQGQATSEEEQAAKLKAEKIRVALEKIKEAQVKKLVIRVHLSDESSKTMMVDERQTVRQVLDSLLDKSHCGYSADWSLVETINELQMERIFEDHENLVENLLNWTRDSQNRLMFIERIEKYALFKNPQNYLLGRKETCEMADRNKEALLEECFGGSSISVPEIEGVLWLKEDGKKSWKKRYFLLRASGIYFVPKGKAKASRDLVCFLQLDHVNVCYGLDYRSKYKAPTDHCLVLKHPQIQKKSQYIKYLCCDDVRTLHQWVNGIRIAKYGKQLYLNYQEATKRAEAAYDWSSLSSSSMKSGSSSSSLPESQSNHSSQSDSGVSETTSSGHVRSQSAVSSIFSEAWKRGTQIEENTKPPSRASYPLQLPPLSQQHSLPHSQTRSSYSGGGMSPQSSPSPPSPPPPPPPPPPLPSNAYHSPPTTFTKYSTIARLQSSAHQYKQTPMMQHQQPPNPPPQSVKPLTGNVAVPAPPPPPPAQMPAPGSAMAVLKLGPPSPGPFTSPQSQQELLPPPPPEAHFQTNGILPPPPPEQPKFPALSTNGLQQFLAQKFPNMSYDFTSPKQQSFSSAISPNQPPPTLPKQHSFPAKAPSLSTPISPTPSLVKQFANQFPGSTQSGYGDPSKAPLSPPVVKAKPKWQPGGQPQSPEFPPPPPESSLDFPPPPPPALDAVSPPTPHAKTGSPMKKSPSTSSFSTGSVKRPPPTPQRNSSIKSSPQTSTPSSSLSTPASASGSPSKDPAGGPRAPPKPGKINLANLPLALQGKAAQYPQSSGDFPSPPSECDYFPPPPPDSELLPPPPSDLQTGAPKVAVVNPQPQLSSITSTTSSWKSNSVKKSSLHRRSNGPPEPLVLSPPAQQNPVQPFSSSVPPTSPKGSLSLQPNFLEDLNRTLKRKSISRHGSLTSSRISAKLEPVATMDDMALPPPPPELMLDQPKRGGRYSNANISGYATLRRGPPPAPPKRDQNTKLTGEW
uniref:Ras-associated and pleckstrin homology domains-containing protein 1 n=1 Tax=Denticeps clupeoides TaxID=299321 RepID=A0AAY4B514_9TELE